ncbi:MAG: hypothetical protein ACAI25_07970 [Planctomycetota bacterium]
MEEERLRLGDRVTVRKGAPLPPDGKRRLEKDFHAKVVSVEGRRVKVALDEHYVDEDGSRMVTPYAVFDLTYVYRLDS